jgi:hypothetical protein
LRATAALDAAATALRWRYTTGPAPHGRGVYVDAVSVGGRLIDDALFQPNGWALSEN